MFIRTQTNGDRTYLMLVENERVGGRLVQRVLHRFGRLDELRASGQIDGLLRSLGRFGDKDHRYVVRSEIKRTVGKVFQACGVAIPPALRPA